MQFYHSKLLNSLSNVTHAFTLRDSGNLAFHVGDNESHVQANHEKLAKELNYKKASLVHMKQIHSDIVHLVIDDEFDNPPTCDALITNKIETPLMVMVADCAPILFYDYKKRVIAAAHAGRAGAFKNIVKKVVDSFTNEFNSETQHIYVSIGASIGVCCYEVGSEIKSEAKELKIGYAIEKRETDFYLDIRKILKTQLIERGIKEENIEISDECTRCKNDKYFSYRVNSNTGRFSGVIMLR